MAYIVKRELGDSHNGHKSPSHYIKVDRPRPGETFYHGEFTSKTIEVQDTGQAAFTPLSTSRSMKAL